LKGQHGYAGKMLRVDLSSGNQTKMPTTDYADRFLGGRGVAAKIYWDEVPPEVGALAPENRLLFMTGPLAGFTGLAGSRWTVCGKSPATIPEQFSYSNLGGRWGAQLKFSGYDGIVVQGKSEKPVYLFIHDGVAEIKDASYLWGKSTIEVREILKMELGSRVAVVACGPAGENMVTFASLLADNDSSGSSGFGAVMGSKKLKAIAVTGEEKLMPANPEKLEELKRYIRELKKGTSSITDKRQLIGKQKKDLCYGCPSGCSRAVREAKDGRKHKFFCGPSIIFYIVASMYYGELNEVPFYDIPTDLNELSPFYEVPLHATILLDEYGLDVYTVITTMIWLLMCNQSGILTDEETGIPVSKMGSMEFIETFLRKISLRDGFGDILARGPARAAEIVGKGAKDLLNNYEYVSKEGRVLPYDPRMYIAHSLLYAMEPTLPINHLHEFGATLFQWLYWANKTEGTPIAGVEGTHVSSDVVRKIAERFWGGELAADFSTYDGKALAAVKIQNRSYIKESLILCDIFWPILQIPTGDHVGDPSIESQILSAVTGNHIDENQLHHIGERIFNLRRAILAREGHKGRENDTIPEIFFTRPLSEATNNPECLGPGKEGQVISRKGAVVDREKFEKMKDEYYQLRGWDVTTGLQTTEKLTELGLEDIVQDLKQSGLVRG